MDAEVGEDISIDVNKLRNLLNEKRPTQRAKWEKTNRRTEPMFKVGKPLDVDPKLFTRLHCDAKIKDRTRMELTKTKEEKEIS